MLNHMIDDWQIDVRLMIGGQVFVIDIWLGDCHWMIFTT